VKSVRLVPVPPGVVTETGPVVVRFRTVATISVSELTSNDAGPPVELHGGGPGVSGTGDRDGGASGPLEGTKSSTVGSGEGVTTNRPHSLPFLHRR
jgi:hypothetical protein